MNKKEKMKMLKEYMKINIMPILVDFIDKDFFENKVVIDANCKKEDLIETYEKEKKLPPKWYQELINKNIKILIIDNIDSISKEEQKKFIEILKHRKTSVFEIPKDVVIIVTAKQTKNKVSQEIFSLTTFIGG